MTTAPYPLAAALTDTAVTGRVIEAERWRLFGLAYRLLGAASDAEDMVQCALERWIEADGTIHAPSAWLTTVVINLCRKHLGQARRREITLGTSLPEPEAIPGRTLGPLETIEQRESVSLALLVLMQRLTGPERAVFVLREAFRYPYAEIAEILERSDAGCRQLHRRAAWRLTEPHKWSRPDRWRWRQLTERFLAAAADGQMTPLEQLLADHASHTPDSEA